MICVQTILQAGKFSRLFSLFFYKIIFSGNTRLRHMDRIQNTIKFILVHKLFFQNQTSYRFACLNCLFCDIIRSLLISKMGADCSDNTYTVFYQITASFSFCRNSYNTIIHQCLDCIAKSIDRLEHAIENNRLKRI